MAFFKKFGTPVHVEEGIEVSAEEMLELQEESRRRREKQENEDEQDN